jgi:hypothetical protein
VEEGVIIMKPIQSFSGIACVLLLMTVASGCWLFARQSQPSDKDAPKNAVSYTVLDDDMGTIIKIGVNPDITEKQLRATLVKAANDHQDDAARDYLTSMFLRVEAYLIKDESRSTTTAGTLRRYVPPGNPAERRKLTSDRTKGDTFTITLDNAKKTLH